MSAGLGFGPGSSLPARRTAATRASAAPDGAPSAGAASGTGGGVSEALTIPIGAFEASNLAAMSPEGLLDELAERAALDTTEHFPSCDYGDTWRDCQDCRRIHARCRSTLAAVLPAHEAMVRARVAEELIERAGTHPLGSAFRRHLRAAAQMAVHITPQQAAQLLNEIYEAETRGET